MPVQIFFSCSQSASDMPFRFISVQDFSCFLCKRRVDRQKTVCYIFMYRALAHPKLFCCLSHRCFMFNDIICNLYRPLFDVIFHIKNPCIVCFLQSMQGFFNVCLIRFSYSHIFRLQCCLCAWCNGYRSVTFCNTGNCQCYKVNDDRCAHNFHCSDRCIHIHSCLIKLTDKPNNQKHCILSIFK